MAALAPPVAVSPFIRFCRWTLLGTGLVYGITRQGRLKKKEDRRRAYEAEQKVIRDAKLVIEKKRATKEEMLYLAKEANVPVPDDFEKQFS